MPAMKPRVLFVGRTRYRMPLPESLRKKWDALGEQLDFQVLASSADGSRSSGRFQLVRPLRPRALDGLAFYASLPLRARGAIRRLRPDVVVAESPHVGAAVVVARALAGVRPRVIVEVHGDWRSATRFYGSPWRRLLSPLTDRLAVAALRRADAVRALSDFTAQLATEASGRPVASMFPTFSDLEVFAERPPSPMGSPPTALFVGVLERYKNIENLAAAWRLVARELPEARLIIVGSGSLNGVVDALRSELPQRVEHVLELSPAGVAERLDRAWTLVLPSQLEGLGRVVIEAFARGRGVVVSRRGGILDLVREGVEGLLVDPEDVDELARALATVLSDRALAERLGEAARRRFAEWQTTADEFASRMRALVDDTLAA
jgi:glycosyltransferase involved in cell wall biosynthesis